MNFYRDNKNPFLDLILWQIKTKTKNIHIQMNINALQNANLTSINTEHLEETCMKVAVCVTAQETGAEKESTRWNQS